MTGKPPWQMSLKTCLLLLTIVALAIGWWSDRRRLESRLVNAQRRIQDLETSHYFDVVPDGMLP